MKKFKDLTKGDKLYEVYSDKLITHEVASSAIVDKTIIIPIKALKGDEREMYMQMLPKSYANKTAYKYPSIYRAIFTSLDEAKMNLKSNLESFKERAEWKIRDIRDSLERQQARLLRIIKDLQNVDNLQD